MSFQHKGFWMPRDAGCLTDGEIGYDNSTRIEPKRSHQWFMDPTGSELLSNKKQAIESLDSKLVSGISRANVSHCHSPPSFESLSGQFANHLFGSEPVQIVNLVDRKVSSINSGSLKVGRKDFQAQYSNASMGLSMSHITEDPSCFNVGGIRKVKVNQVRESGTGLSASMGLSYGRGDIGSMSRGTTYDKSDNNSMSLVPNNINSNENTISMGSFSKSDSSFISIGHTLNKGEENGISMGYNYSQRNDSISLMGQLFDKGDGNFISISQSSEKGDSNVMSIGSCYKGHPNFLSMGQTYDKANENFITVDSFYNKGSDNATGMPSTYDKADSNITSVSSSQDKGDFGVLSMDHNFSKGETNTISFGAYQDEPGTNPSGNMSSSYNLLMSTRNSAQASQESRQMNSVEPNVDSIVNYTPRANPRTDTVPKSKESKASKKVPASNFPSNVKSLLSTGMLDGVPVKYVSWSREKNLKGTIKGTGYLCSCNDCNFSKALNAYEFERHANCKTKHPNNHIFFENGKTIYAVVQELKNTPQAMLFDAIQNVTGSQINQKNFLSWKASYQAATRELQRIYGKDEIVMPS